MSVRADNLEELLKEHVEADIIARLASKTGLSAEEALRTYYSSRLAIQIEDGTLGLQYLDPDNLAIDLMTTELQSVKHD